MHKDILYPVLVEVNHPRVFLVVGNGDLHLLRLPGKYFWSRYADENNHNPWVIGDEEIRVAIASNIPDAQGCIERSRVTLLSVPPLMGCSSEHDVEWHPPGFAMAGHSIQCYSTGGVGCVGIATFFHSVELKP